MRRRGGVSWWSECGEGLPALEKAGGEIGGAGGRPGGDFRLGEPECGVDFCGGEADGSVVADLIEADVFPAVLRSGGEG